MSDDSLSMATTVPRRSKSVSAAISPKTFPSVKCFASAVFKVQCERSIFQQCKDIFHAHGSERLLVNG